MIKEAAIAALRERRKREAEAVVDALVSNEVKLFVHSPASAGLDHLSKEEAVDIVMLGRRNWDIKQSGLTPSVYAYWEQWVAQGCNCTALTAKGKPCRRGANCDNPYVLDCFVLGKSDRCEYHQEEPE